MGNRNISTTVQNGESLSLYANMYNCSVEDIKKANPGKIGKNGQLKAGSDIIIPIGQPPKDTQPQGSYMEKKLKWFDDQLENAKIELFSNDNMKPKEREKKEEYYIRLKNCQKLRPSMADIKIEGDHFKFTLKKGMTLAEFRQAFPECTKNFYDYCDKNGMTTTTREGTFAWDPKDVTLPAGYSFTVRATEFANDGGLADFWQGAKDLYNDTKYLIKQSWKKMF